MKKKIYLIALCAAFTTFIYSQTLPSLYRQADSLKMKQWVDSVFNTMTGDEKIGQLFMPVVDPKPTDLHTRKTIEYIRKQKIGGILFAKGRWEDQAKSTNLYQKEANIPLMISLDGEWGLAMRLDRTVRFPRNMMAGAITDLRTLERYGAEVARQCRLMGIHVNFAPVLDVNSNPANPVIGSRSYGENPKRVIAGGLAYSKGLESGRVMAVAKHFPGHGDTDEDSHHTLPVLRHSLQELEEKDLLPFRAYVDSGFSGVMTGHLQALALDSASTRPSSLSPAVVTGWLRDSLGFAGLAFTDALVMKGAVSEKNACVQALLAGNDILLSPGKPVEDYEAVRKAVSKGMIPIDLIDQKCRKVLQYKYLLGLNDYRPIQIDGLERELHTDSADWICRKMNAEAITLLKNKNDLIPLKYFEKRRIASLSIGSARLTPFQLMLKKYTKVDAYTLPVQAKPTEIAHALKELEDYQVVICGIHSPKDKESAALQQLLKDKKIVLSFFISPYSISAFRQMIAGAEAVVMAYENTDYAQEYAAQAVMGGLSVAGKLPVGIPALFEEGTGIETQQTRLAYRSPIEVGMSPETLRQIDLIVQDAIKQEAFPGCQVLVAKDGAVVYEKGFGYFDYAHTHPVKTNDLYDLASVTKVAATVPAVMKLYDEGRLQLSTKLGDHVSQLKGSDKAGITVQDALFHESGLVPFIPFYQQAIDADSYKGPLFSNKRTAIYRVEHSKNTYARTDFKYLPDLVSAVSKPGFTVQVAKSFYVSDNFKLIMLREIASSTLRRNKSYRYSDLNFILLKEAVEAISGQAFDRFLDATFYERIGANHTMFRPLSEKVAMERIAPTENDRVVRNQILAGYVHDEAAAFLGGVSGNAGLFSNANDLAKLLQMFLNKGQYGGETYYSPATSDVFLHSKSARSRRGLGFDRPDPAEKPDYLPASVFGHTGFTGTCVWADPDNQLIYILLANRVYPSRTNVKMSTLQVRESVWQTIYDAIKKTEGAAAKQQ